MSEESTSGEKKAPTAGVPGWHEDPYKKAAERLWDGSKWTSETRGELPKPNSPGSAEGTAATEAGYKGGGSARKWIRTRPVLWVSLAAVVAFFIGIAVGGGNTSSKDDQIADQEAKIASLQADLDAAESEKDALASKEAQLDKQAAKLDVREEKVSTAEAIEKQNSFGDGIWKVGTDFDAGTYRAEGGTGCYWALLNSADTADIINNGGFGPNQTLTIDSPWFETDGCGEWTKIG